LIEVICHELAHAILTDIDPKNQDIDGGHSKKHDQLTKELQKILKTFSEYQELKKL
jgi:hypothetical protein